MSTTTENSIAFSARSEEYFREVKNLIFKDATSNRVYKFVILHLRSLAGTMKLLNAPNNFSSQYKIKSVCSNIAVTAKKTFHDCDTFNDTFLYS